MKSLQQIVKILKKIKFYWLFNRSERKALSLRSTSQRNFLKLHRLQKSFYNLLFFFKNLLHHTTHFACSVSPLYRHGRRWFQTSKSFRRKSKTLRWKMYTDVHFSSTLRPASQADAKIAAPAVRTVVVPPAYSAAARVVAPAAAAKNTDRAWRGTLRIGNNTALHISSIVWCRVIIMPIKTPFPDIPAHIV